MKLLAYSFNHFQVFIYSLANFLFITPAQVSDGGLLVFFQSMTENSIY